MTTFTKLTRYDGSIRDDMVMRSDGVFVATDLYAPPASDDADEQAARDVWLAEQPDTAAFLAWLQAGNAPSAPLPPAPVVPAQIDLWKARAILAEKGLLDKADAAVNAANNPALTAVWQYGNVITRSSPHLAVLAQALALAPADVDQLFIAANVLTA